MRNPLSSPTEYQAFIYGLPQNYPSVRHSTLIYIPTGTLFGRLEGVLVFDQAIVLCVKEFLNFELGVIEGYGYEVSRSLLAPDAPDFPVPTDYCRATYSDKEKLFWYDSFPHPNDPSLSSTAPHHKHLPPNIDHHRVPAANLSFTRPNLPFLIGELEGTLLA